MTTPISIRVEATPGAHVRDVCKALIELANRLQSDIESKFNDVTIIATPGVDTDALVKAWEEARDSRYGTKIAVAHPENAPENRGDNGE